MNHFSPINQMIILASSYWNVGFERKKDYVKANKQALKITEDLGKNMAWLLRKLKA